jgi:hypothetical protein
MNAAMAAQDVNDEVSSYFRGLGFEVTWDFSKRSGHRWYEIYDGRTLLCQIDMGVPLASILLDLPLLAIDALGMSTGIDYTVACDDTSKLRLICSRMEMR